MSIERTPFQIILIEQILNSIYVFVAFGLFVSYAPKVLIKYSGLEAEAITYIYIGVALTLVFGWFYIWLPYTCARIWRSSKALSNKVWFLIFRSYSGILFVSIVVSGIGALFKLPEIIDLLKIQ